MLFLKKSFCKSNLSPVHKIFTERPGEIKHELFFQNLIKQIRWNKYESNFAVYIIKFIWSNKFDQKLIWLCFYFAMLWVNFREMEFPFVNVPPLLQVVLLSTIWLQLLYHSEWVWIFCKCFVPSMLKWFGGINT